jgi:hypothetical protein
MLKIVQEFLKTPSKEMIKHIGEIERQRQQEISKKRPIKIVEGKPILSKGTISSHIPE